MIYKQFPPEAFEQVFKAPEVYSSSGDDFSPPSELYEIKWILEDGNLALSYLLVDEEQGPVGFIIAYRENQITLTAHVGFLKGFRGSTAKRCIMSAINDAFSNGFLKINAHFPCTQRGLRYLLTQVGFEHEGVNRKSILMGGMLLDQLSMGLTKENWYAQRSIRQ